MKDRGILALDFGLTSAVAYGYPGDTPIWRRRCFSVEPGGEAGILHAFSVWLEHRIGEFKPAYFVYEPAFIHPERISAAPRLLGMQGIARATAYRLGIKTRDYSIQEVARFHGTSGLKSTEKKRITRESIEQLYGWSPVTSDEADALALWLFAENQLSPQTRRSVGPLFSPKREVVDVRNSEP